MKKEFENSHCCAKMINGDVTGVIIQVDGIWYEIRNNCTHQILFCPNCGYKPNEKDCYAYGKEPR